MLNELIVSLRPNECFRAHLLSVSCYHSDEIVNYSRTQTESSEGGTSFLIFYHLQTKLREGTLFTPVCHSGHSGVWCGRHPLPGRHPLADTHTTPGKPTPVDGHCTDGTHPTGMHSSF